MGFSDLSDWEETGSALTMSDDEDPWGSADLPEISWVLLEQQQQKKHENFEAGEICSKFHPFDKDFDMISIVILMNVTSIIVIILYMIKLIQDP